jgi:MoaA/NifB/PqqE/SkfB family radical SAM enzyme
VKRRPLDVIQTAARFAIAAAGGPRQLLGVGWEVTRVCNARCPFCDRHSGPKGPSTDVALRLIDELAACGCTRVHITGGEPLLRDDLDVLLQRIASRGMASSVNTNGTLLAQRDAVVDSADAFLVSIDGPEEVHDAYRGKRAYRRLMDGLEALEKKQKRYAFYVALFQKNLGHLDFFVELAKRHSTFLIVQPGSLHVIGSDAPNPETPELSAYRKALRRLREPDYRPYVWNSDPGLDVLATFPEPYHLRCHAGRITCRLEVDGSMFPCSRTLGDPRCLPAPNAIELGVAEAFRRLPKIDCSGSQCWAAHSVEKNLMFSGSPGAVWNIVTRNYMARRREA